MICKIWEILGDHFVKRQLVVNGHLRQLGYVIFILFHSQVGEG